jgi:hypothetical protein
MPNDEILLIPEVGKVDYEYADSKNLDTLKYDGIRSSRVVPFISDPNKDQIKNLFHRYNVEDLENILPQVYVLPVEAKNAEFLRHYRETDPGYSDLFFRGEFSHTVKFLDWFNDFYNKTSKTGSDATVFYFPHWLPQISIKPNKLLEIENELDRMLTTVDRSKIPYFALDRVFMNAAFPLQTTSMNDLNNIRDIRLLRVDEDWAINGREIYVPYLVDRSLFNINEDNYNKTREHLIVAPCKFARSEFRWRENVYLHWKDEKDVIVSKEYMDMNSLFEISDFCAIMPGDTSSTSKLYKSIFQGCIPVIFVSFYDQLPFSRFIDWSLFSIVLLKDITYFEQGMKSLVRYLRDIRKDLNVLLRMKHNLLAACRLFDSNIKDWPSLYHLTILHLVDLEGQPLLQNRKVFPTLSRLSTEYSYVDKYLLKSVF